MNYSELQHIYTSNIKRLRFEKGLSQSELAERAGISVTFISSIETGKKWGSFQTLADIAAALDVAPFQLLMPSGSVSGRNDQISCDFMKHLIDNLSDTVIMIKNHLNI